MLLIIFLIDKESYCSQILFSTCAYGYHPFLLYWVIRDQDYFKKIRNIYVCSKKIIGLFIYDVLFVCLWHPWSILSPGKIKILDYTDHGMSSRANSQKSTTAYGSTYVKLFHNITRKKSLSQRVL